MVDYPPIPLTRDIDDAEVKDREQGLDCKAFHERIAATIEFTKSAIEKDIKPDIEQSDDNQDHGHRFVLSSFLSGMKDTLSVIQLIHGKYNKDTKPELLCAISLSRGLVEAVFTIAILLRFPNNMFASFARSSEVNDYYRYAYLKKESENLPRMYNGYLSTCNENKQKLENSVFLEKPFTKREIQSIENLAGQGKALHGYTFPTPMGVLNLMTKNCPNDPILIILKRLYIEYRWLCGYTHIGHSSLLIAGYMRLNNISESDKKELMEKEVVWPIIVIGFLSALIVLTDISKYINEPADLRSRLTKDWVFFERNSLIGSFAWDNWAKNLMGLDLIE